MKKLTGAVIAAAVAGLFMAGRAIAGDQAGGHDAKVCCSGGNACKGKGACKGQDNSCSGKNGCKGKGWVKMEGADACTKASGKVVDCPKM